MNTESTMNPAARAYASLSISGDTLQPEFWTRYFDVEPDVSIVKGTPFSTPSGHVLYRRTGVWGVSSKAAIQSDLLDPHFRYLIKHLGLPRTDLRDLLSEADVKIRFFCYWFKDTGDRVPDVASDIREMMETLGGIVDIDEY